MAQPELTPSSLDEIVTWLESLGQKATTIELRRPGAPKRIGRWERPANGNASHDELAQKILKAAQVDAMARLIPIVVYDLDAFGPSSDDSGEGTYPLRVKGASSGKAGALDVYEADIGQAFVHVLRQNADLMRLLMASKETGQEVLMRQIEYQGKALAGADERRVELFRLLEDLGSARTAIEIEKANTTLLEKRQEIVAKQLQYYMPVVMNRLLGGGPGTGKTPMAEQLVDTLLGHMTREQTEALIKGDPVAFSEEQRVLFAELYTAAAAKHAAREARPIGADPAAGANGANGANGTNGTNGKGASP